MHALLMLLGVVLCGSPCRAKAAEPQLLGVSMHSEALSAFWKQPVTVDAQVLLPDDYDKQPQRRFPTIYYVHAFGGSDAVSFGQTQVWLNAQRAAHFEAILVFLDANINGGHHVFADSQNYGPWAKALTTEFIPQTDRHLRTIAGAGARFISGHSSGGWSALWLGINYPAVFGGVWAISPDPVDFHDFTGPDLTQVDPGNFYRDKAGHPYGIMVRNGHDAMTLQALATQPGWGSAQFHSFEEVFSPRGADGKAELLFDRRTGAINADVAHYWEQHWDIDAVLRERWPSQGAQLRGKLHVFVGTPDTFHLDRPLRLMQAELTALGADAAITFVPGADHWSIFGYHGGLIAEIVREVAAVSQTQ